MCGDEAMLCRTRSVVDGQTQPMQTGRDEPDLKRARTEPAAVSCRAALDALTPGHRLQALAYGAVDLGHARHGGISVPDVFVVSLFSGGAVAAYVDVCAGDDVRRHQSAARFFARKLVVHCLPNWVTADANGPFWRRMLHEAGRGNLAAQHGSVDEDRHSARYRFDLCVVGAFLTGISFALCRLAHARHTFDEVEGFVLDAGVEAIFEAANLHEPTALRVLAGVVHESPCDARARPCWRCRTVLSLTMRSRFTSRPTRRHGQSWVC
jgi:hypothetical protein